MIYVEKPDTDDDEIIARIKKSQEVDLDVAKSLKKILSGVVVISYCFGISFTFLLFFIDVPQAFIGASLQIAIILFAVFVAFFVSALARIKGEIREFYRLLAEYNLKFGELELRKDISATEKKNMRNRTERALYESLSRYKAPEAKQFVLKTAVYVVSFSLIISLFFAFGALIFQNTFLAKICWVFLVPSIFVMVSQIPFSN